MRHRIVFLDRDTLAPHVAVRRPAFDHDWIEYERTAADQVAERLADATIAITNKVPMLADALAGAPSLSMIAVAATGTDMIDKAACATRGIIVSNIRGYARSSVPEHTFALILALSRAVVPYHDDVRDGAWQHSGLFCHFGPRIADLAGCRLGIIGEGVIGRAVADIGRGFGMEPVFAAHKGRDDMGELYTPFETVLETSDVITLHCPLTPETRSMIAMPEFRRMLRRPLLINTARGGLVDETDLVRALDDGLIAGAGFDVLTAEPPPNDHPLLALLGRPNFILTPHVAWASDGAMQTLADQLIDNIEAFAAGRPVNLVVG